MFCVLLQSEKCEGSVHLFCSGAKRASEGTGKKHRTVNNNGCYMPTLQIIQ